MVIDIRTYLVSVFPFFHFALKLIGRSPDQESNPGLPLDRRRSFWSILFVVEEMMMIGYCFFEMYVYRVAQKNKLMLFYAQGVCAMLVLKSILILGSF